jgi:hypothetical protein
MVIATPPRGRWPGVRACSAVLALYSLALGLATAPFLRRFGRSLPAGWVDAYQALWVMKQNRACLLRGEWPWFSADIHCPTGAPLGLFSPLHLQSLIFIPLSAVFDDVTCYDLIWFGSLLLTGLGTYLLAWWVVRDTAAACLGGLGAMLSGPLLLQAHGALELIQLGGLALFLIAWLRLVDRPGVGRLAAAVALYVLVAMTAAYFAVFAIFPAALYVAWEGLRCGRAGFGAWALRRLGWLAGFGGLAVVGLLVLFSSQIWAESQGHAAPRPRWQFTTFRAPAWSYAVPTPLHVLGALIPKPTYDPGAIHPTGYSYLGVVTLLLLLAAALGRCRFPRAGYWWACLGMLVMLSAGDYWKVGGWTVPLPAGWLRDHWSAFRSIRVPARFNLLVAVVAAVPAAAGARALLGRLGRPGLRRAAIGTLVVAATADLAMVPFVEEPRAAMPAVYAWLKRRDPSATLVEAPQFGSDSANWLGAATLYWQSIHGLPTSTGYSGQGNARRDNLSTWNSPFFVGRLNDPHYLDDPDATAIDMVRGVRFEDYAWVYMTVNGFRYALLHRWTGSAAEQALHLEPVLARLRHAAIFEDAATVLYDRERLARPGRAVLLCAEGWGHRRLDRGRPTCALDREARVVVYNPDPDTELSLSVELAALRRRRNVRLLDQDGTLLARWEVVPREYRVCRTPPLRLPRGLRTLTIASDGKERPRRPDEQATEGDPRPYSLRAAEIRLIPQPPRLAEKIP